MADPKVEANAEVVEAYVETISFVTCPDCEETIELGVDYEWDASGVEDVECEECEFQFQMKKPKSV